MPTSILRCLFKKITKTSDCYFFFVLFFSACNNGTIKLQASSQTTNLTSPSYPSTYPMSCHWLIEAPQGKQVKLTFTSIQIYFCEEETLHVYDGETPQVVLKKCRIDRGSNEVTYLERNKPIFSYGRELLVVFKTDEYFVSDFKGFTASYTAVEGGMMTISSVLNVKWKLVLWLNSLVGF